LQLALPSPRAAEEESTLHTRGPFLYFGGVPTRIVYDETTIAADGIWNERTRAFSELQSHYLLADKFGRSANHND
jgi:hypothetical protein